MYEIFMNIQRKKPKEKELDDDICPLCFKEVDYDHSPSKPAPKNKCHCFYYSLN